MERELIFSANKRKQGHMQLLQEIKMIERILPYTDCFESFKTSNEVFDIDGHKTITNSFRLRHIFKKGIDKKVSYFIICKN